MLKLNAAADTFSCPEAIYYNNSYLTKPINGWYPIYEDVLENMGNYDGLAGQEILLYRKNGTANIMEVELDQ